MGVISLLLVKFEFISLFLVVKEIGSFRLVFYECCLERVCEKERWMKIRDGYEKIEEFLSQSFLKKIL